jgi:hypothetical protein
MNRLTVKPLWWSALLIISLLSCDKISQDILPPGTDDSLDDNALTVLPDQPVAVDLRTLATLNTATTFTISDPPESGEAKFAQSGILLYTPNGEFVAGEDNFTVGTDVKLANKTVIVPFKVEMALDGSDLPCKIGAIPDQADTPANTSIAIGVLKNDKFCEGTPDPATLKIKVAPKSGTVRVLGSDVVYIPTNGFNGRDFFVYNVCNAGASTQTCALGVVTITVGDPLKNCKITLRDDQVPFRPVFQTDSIVIPVLANDQLCRANRALLLTVLKAPTNGTARVNADNQLVYKLKTSTWAADELTYQRCESGTCLTAVVRVKTVAAVAGCKLTTTKDTRTISLSNPTIDVRLGTVLLPVLLNDKLCGPLKAMRISANPANAKLEILRDGTIVYRLDAQPKKGTLIFTYELTDAANTKATADVVLTIK